MHKQLKTSSKSALGIDTEVTKKKKKENSLILNTLYTYNT